MESETARGKGNERKDDDRSRRKVLDVLDWLSDVGGVVSGVMILATTLLIAVSVIMRYVFNAPIEGVDELSGYLLIMIVYMGLGYSFKEGAFIRAGIVYERLQSRLKLVADMLIHLIAIAFLLIVNIYFWQQVGYSFASRTASAGTLHMPLYIPQGIMAIGTSLLTFQALISLLRILARSWKRGTVAASDRQAEVLPRW